MIINCEFQRECRRVLEVEGGGGWEVEGSGRKSRGIEEGSKEEIHASCEIPMSVSFPVTSSLSLHSHCTDLLAGI